VFAQERSVSEFSCGLRQSFSRGYRVHGERKAKSQLRMQAMLLPELQRILRLIQGTDIAIKGEKGKEQSRTTSVHRDNADDEGR